MRVPPTCWDLSGCGAGGACDYCFLVSCSRSGRVQMGKNVPVAVLLPACGGKSPVRVGDSLVSSIWASNWKTPWYNPDTTDSVVGLVLRRKAKKWEAWRQKVKGISPRHKHWKQMLLCSVQMWADEEEIDSCTFLFMPYLMLVSALCCLHTAGRNSFWWNGRIVSSKRTLWEVPNSCCMPRPELLIQSSERNFSIFRWERMIVKFVLVPWFID